MNKKNNGFTLVELLAVIVILGVIGLIATPIVNDYVKDAKEDRIINSLNNIERAAINYFTSENIRNSKVVDLKSGLIELDNNDLNKGIAVGNRDSVKIYIYKNGYCGIKDGDNITVKKMEESACNFNVDDNIELITSNKVPKNKKILGYRIYGNTVDNVSLGDNKTITLKLNGKNLFAKSLIKVIDSYRGIEIATSPKKYTLSITLKENKVIPSGSYFGIAYKLNSSPSYAADWFVSNGVLKKTVATFSNSASNYKYLVGTYYFPDEKLFDTFDILLEEGTTATTYEPYLEPKEYTITLSEPLRKYGNKVDYIDSSINQIVRNVGVRADGTLYELETPTYEYIKLPSITNLDGTTIVSSSDGNINSSKIEIITKN